MLLITTHLVADPRALHSAPHIDALSPVEQQVRDRPDTHTRAGGKLFCKSTKTKRAATMGKGCVKATKYFLFLLNLLFFLCGGVIMGFGLWLLLDNQSFIVVLNDSTAVKIACYILIGVGVFSMLLGFLGCVGAIYEVRCLLGLYFTCLLLILLAQIAAGALIYFQKESLHDETAKVISKVLDGYPWQKLHRRAGLGLHPEERKSASHMAQ
ncbi:hypothetical protein fugu_002890 [Takifugu bimaculatus]|uniref:CD82 antigen n=1 Tax=Takifugu bimaculatus TaxID=433685 RepID=A0A4Z2BDU9_9TELE|nr:hypothetical protein fugu_002890 [Takifugu bimaculatus]